MNAFFDELLAATAAERETLLRQPLFADALAGRVTRSLYRAFLTEAYHHVRHTVPLMMACGARLDADYEWLRGRLIHYVEEEYGHHEWILSDIAAAGGDAEAVRHGQPGAATELMVAYAYDTIHRRNPVGFLGMVLVLEGTSTALATRAARSIAAALSLPENAFRYLTSHGELDQAHIGFYADLVNRLERSDDRAALVHGARMFYRLYGEIFHHLHREFAPCASTAAASS